MRNHISSSYKSIGFTLIELMLVAALIAALSVIGVNAYRQQLVNFQVDKSALQMQQWLEGAVAYYVQNNKWPQLPANQPAGCTSINQILEATAASNPCNVPTPVVTYITAGSMDTNPWGGTYTLTVPDASPSQRFEVSITGLPGANIARRIAARLPSTDPIADGSTSVNAYVTVPSQGKSTVGTVLSVSDYCVGTVPGKTASKPIPIPDASKCAPGTTPTLHLAFQDLQGVGVTGYGPGDNPSAISAIETDAQKDSTQKNWAPVLTVNGANWVTPPTNNTNNCMLAIVSCDAPSSGSSTAANTNNKPHFLF
jgi:Tfp pilus assembly protein PilE